MTDKPRINWLPRAQYATQAVLLMALLGVSISTARSIKLQLFPGNVDAVALPVIETGNVLLPPQGKWRFEGSPYDFAMGHDLFTHPELSPPRAATHTPHLLPLQAQAKRMCGRWSDSEELMMEIVQLDASPAKLLAAWRESGWEIRHSPWGEPNSFSYLCVKNGRVVYAWSQQTDTITSLLLSSSHDVTVHHRTPSEAGHS